MITEHLHPAARLKQLREQMQLSQRELAKEFMVSSGAIASWELGSNPIPGPVLKLIDLYEQNNTNSREEHEKLLADVRKVLRSLRAQPDDSKAIENGLNVFLKDFSFINSFQAKFKYGLIKKGIEFLGDSKGLTIKIAQLASYMEMGLPVEVRLALGNLQSTLKPMPKKTLEETLEKSLGKKIADVFPVFDLRPIAVTSLGQVHYAKRTNGQEVAVKIQHPDVQAVVNGQFKKVGFLEKLGLFDKEVSDILKEIKRAIIQECDYLEEARNQEKIRALLKDLPRAIVPKVHQDLSTKELLVTEFVHGQNFKNFAATASQDSKNIVAESLCRCLTKLAFSHHMVLTDNHPENFLIKNDKVVFLDFGRVYRPQTERMRYETMFYRAWLKNEKEIARGLVERVGFAKDPATFDFDEFYSFLWNSSVHLAKNEKFKFTREHTARLAREGRRFAQKKTLRLTSEAFWGFTFSAETWGLYAELEAECNWHQMALETFNEALAH